MLIVNSYVERGRDIVLNFLEEFVRREHYDLDMYTIKYGLEVDRVEEGKSME